MRDSLKSLKSLLSSLATALARPFATRYASFGLCRGLAPAELFPCISPDAPRTRPLPIVVDDFSASRFLAYQSAVFLPQSIGSFSGIVGRQGEHITADNRLIGEFSFGYKESPANHRSLHGVHKSPRIHSVATPVIALVGKGSYNLYHFLLEVLPKLPHLSALAPADAAIYVDTSQPFSRAIVEHLFPSRTIIPAQDFPLIASPQIFGMGTPKPYGQVHPSAAAATATLLSTFAPLSPDTPRRILVSRQNATRRRVANWSEVASWARAHDFTEVALEKLSFADQVRLFRSAQFVIAPHGAGLAHLVFCPPSTRVLELLSGDGMVASNAEVCYWALADSIGLTYGCLECPLARWGRDIGEYDLVVDVLRLEALYYKLK